MNNGLTLRNLFFLSWKRLTGLCLLFGFRIAVLATPVITPILLSAWDESRQNSAAQAQVSREPEKEVVYVDRVVEEPVYVLLDFILSL